MTFNADQFRDHLLGFMNDTGININNDFVQLGKHILPARSDFFVRKPSNYHDEDKHASIHIPHESGGMISVGISQNPFTVGGLSFDLNSNTGSQHKPSMDILDKDVHRATISSDPRPFQSADHLWSAIQEHRERLENVLRHKKLADWVLNENHRYIHEPYDPEAPISGTWSHTTDDFERHVTGGFNSSRNYQFKRNYSNH